MYFCYIRPLCSITLKSESWLYLRKCNCAHLWYKAISFQVESRWGMLGSLNMGEKGQQLYKTKGYSEANAECAAQGKF